MPAAPAVRADEHGTQHPPFCRHEVLLATELFRPADSGAASESAIGLKRASVLCYVPISDRSDSGAEATKRFIY